MTVIICILGMILCYVCLHYSYAFTRYKLKTEKEKVRFLRFFEVISGSVFAHVAYDIIVAALLLGLVSFSDAAFISIRTQLGYPINTSAWFYSVKAVAGLVFTLIAAWMVDKYIYSMHERVYTAIINSM